MAQKKSTSKSEYWAGQVAKWRESGLPATRYCTKQRIHIASFYNWRKRLAAETSPETAQQAANPRFLPIKVVPGMLGGGETDVVLAIEGGRRLHVKGRLSPAHLAQLAQALDSPC